MLCTILMTRELYQTGSSISYLRAHDGIVHKIDVVDFRIFVSTDIYVSAHTCLYNCTSFTYFTIHY
jgi:hypothetical protein